MKQSVLFFLLLFGFVVFSQQDNSEKIIRELKEKIEQSQKGNRLFLMDSLSNYIVTKTNFESDSIIKETVRYALELDSINIATWQTANLIYYQNNILGKPKVGNALFLGFLETAKKSTNHKSLAKFYIDGGDSFYFLEDQKSSIRYYDEAISEALKANDDRFLALAKLYKGSSLSFLGEFAEASIALQDASKIFQKTKDTFNVIGAKNSLSILYSQNAFYKEAKIERNEAIYLAEKIKSYGHLTSFYFNAATDARKQGDFNGSISYLKLAILANQKSRNPLVYEALMFSSMVTSYAELDSISQAKFYLNELEKFPDRNTVGQNREHYLDALKNFAYAQKEYKMALAYGKEHLAIKNRGVNYEEIQHSEKFLAKVYEAMGNSKDAYLHFKISQAIKDSINSVQNVKALSYYQTIYETEKRDYIIEIQKSDIALLDAQNSRKNQLLFFGSFGFLMTFGILFMALSWKAANKRSKMQEGFSHELIKAGENQRIRTARELHDSVGQKLMLLSKQIKSKGNVEMELLAANTLEELRSISRGLHPIILEKLGVTAAISSLINEVDANTSIFFTHEIENIDNILSQEASLHLYRIFQEALNNMVKHANAKTASITISKNKNTIKTIIKDNGKGFDYSHNQGFEGSLGMKTLMERAKIIKSTFSIDSSKNKGTTIQLTIPI